MIKLFTHTDLDGIGCAVLGKITYEEDINIEFCDYNDVDEKIRNYFENEYSNIDDKVYVTDISVNDETAKLICRKINDNLQNVYLFDHHATAIELNQYNWAFVESEKDGIKNSGTSLFWKHLKKRDLIDEGTDGITQFVELVRSYDTWDWNKTNNQNAKNLNDILYIIGRDEFVNIYSEMLSNIIDAVEDFEIKELHMALLKYKRQEIELYLSKKMEQVKVINRVAFIVADSNISELGNKICNEVDCDYCAIYTGQNISMRSVGNYDVSIIAKQNNGGGHKNASGMPCVGVEKLFELLKIKEIEEKALLNKRIQDIENKLISITTDNETLKQTIEIMSKLINNHD